MKINTDAISNQDKKKYVSIRECEEDNGNGISTLSKKEKPGTEGIKKQYLYGLTCTSGSQQTVNPWQTTATQPVTD